MNDNKTYIPTIDDPFGGRPELSEEVLNRWKRQLKTLDSDKLKNTIERKKKRKQIQKSRKINKK